MEILSELCFELNISRTALRDLTQNLFKAIDTDMNGVIDALEVCILLATLSAMRFNEILYYILHVYDFDDTTFLSIDDVILCLKCLSSGLCKITLNETVPEDYIVEELVIKLFIQELDTNQIKDTTKLKIHTIVDLLSLHPDIRSWYAYFGNPSTAENVFIKKIDAEMRSARTMKYSWLLGSKRYQIENAGGNSNPWLGSVQSLMPIKYSGLKRQISSPDGALELEWIFGYQSEVCSNNIFYNSDGGILYNVGRYVIIYNTDDNTQKLFTGHENEISSLAIHPNKIIVASAEFGENSRVLVWNSQNLQIFFNVEILSSFGVQYISFSIDGNYLSIVGSDIFNSVSVYSWSTRKLIYSSHADQRKAVASTFLSDATLVVCGNRYIYFWMKTAEGYMKRRGIFSRHIEEQDIISLISTGSDRIVTGTMSGLLLLWVDRSCIRFVRAHEGSIHALYANSQFMVSGGNDFRIRLWNLDLDPSVTFDVSNFGYNPIVKGLVLSSDGATIAFGTAGANIFEV